MIHKKGSNIARGNYRPVCLTSVIDQIIVEHMMNNDLFCYAQHSFVLGCSCTTQLLITRKRWTELLDGGDHVGVIYLDFRKAFDTVPHRRLIKKLGAYGIKGSLLTWIENFLSGSRQRVVVNSKLYLLGQKSPAAYHKVAYLGQFCSSFLLMTYLIMYCKDICRWHQAFPRYKFPWALCTTLRWPKSVSWLVPHLEFGNVIWVSFH